MELKNSFEVPAPPDRAWAFLLDVERVAPCMPGAELTEVVDERTWKGRVNLRLGPVSMSFAGTVVMQEKDEEARRVVLKADGREVRGKGAASALVTSVLEPTEAGGTRVSMEADLSVSGAVAQYGRGMIADISKRLTDEFAECLRSQLAAPAEEPAVSAEGPAPSAPPPGRARPRAVSGIRLGLWALLRPAARLLRRLRDAISASRRAR